MIMSEKKITDAINIRSLPPIPRIQRDPNAIVRTPRGIIDIIDQFNAKRIFTGKTIVFFGGGDTLRALYLDFIKLLQNGKSLSDVELAKHHNNHPIFISKFKIQEYMLIVIDVLLIDEIEIETAGIRGMSNRIDCRLYQCSSSSIKVFFIHVGSINNIEKLSNGEWFTRVTHDEKIDIILTSCVYPDLCL